MVFDLQHRWETGEYTDKFIVQWANRDGILGSKIIVSGDKHQVEKVIEVPKNTPGFRVEAVSGDGLFIDHLDVYSGESILKHFKFDEENNRGFCLSKNSDDFGRRCHGGQSYKCIDFCSDGSWKNSQDCTEQTTQCSTLNKETGGVSVVAKPHFEQFVSVSCDDYAHVLS